MSRPGTPIEAYGNPSAASVIGTGASHSDRAGGRLEHEVRRRPEPVLVEGVAADRQRVVDPDRLARDLAGRPGRPPGRS